MQNAQDQVNVATKELNDALNYFKLMEQQQQEQEQKKEMDGKEEEGGENGIKMEEEVGRNSTVHNVNIQKKPQHHVDSDRNMILSNSLSGETENETVDSSSDSFFGEGIVRKMNSVESDSSSPTSSQSRSSTTNNNNKEERNMDTSNNNATSSSSASSTAKSIGSTKSKEQTSSSSSYASISKDECDDDERKEGKANSSISSTTRDKKATPDYYYSTRSSITDDQSSSSLVSYYANNNLNNTSQCNWVQVVECGIPQINGKYHKFEYSDGVPSYSRIDKYEGKETMFTIGRYQSNNDTGSSKKWYITATVPPNIQLAFYVAYAPSFVKHPPKKNWMTITDNGEPCDEYVGAGVRKVPVIEHEPDLQQQKQDVVVVENSSGGGGSKKGLVDNGSNTNSRTRGRLTSRRSASAPRKSIRDIERSLSQGRFRRN